MALQTQIINIPFGTGMDQKTQGELVEPNVAMLDVVNLRIGKTGAYNKRNGYSALTTIPAVSRMGEFNGSPLLFGDNRVFSYSAASAQSSDKGPVPEVVATSVPVYGTVSTSTNYDISYLNGLACIVQAFAAPVDGFSVEYAVVVSVIDATTGAKVVQDVQLPVNMPPTNSPIVRTIAIGSTFVIFLAYNNTLTNIDRYAIDATNVNAGITGPTTIINDASVGGASVSYKMDVCLADSTHYAIAYQAAAATTLVNVATFTETGTTPSATTSLTFLAPASGSYGLACQCNIGDTLWIASTGALSGAVRTVNAVGLNPLTLSVTVVQARVLFTQTNPDYTQDSDNINSLSICPTGTRTFVICGSNGNSNTYYVAVDGSSGTVVPGTQSEVNRLTLGSKLFLFNSRVYAPCASRDFDQSPFRQTQATGFLVDITDATPVRPVATFRARIIDTPSQSIIQCSTVRVGTNRYASLFETKSEGACASLTLCTFDFANSNNFQNYVFGRSVAVSGGMPSNYDGNAITEIGFLQYPGVVSLEVIGSGGSLPAGSYSYVGVYEWTTDNGDGVFSAPSAPSTAAITAGQRMSVRVPSLSVGMKPVYIAPPVIDSPAAAPTRVVVYRADSAGIYRALPNVFPNIPTVGDIIFLDDNPESFLGRSLYSQPGVPGTALPRFCPPSSRCMVVHRNRVYLVSDDGITVWYSGQWVDGEQPWFTDSFTLQVPKGGPITALASMDGVLYIFKENLIFSVTGDGPADNGTGNDLSTPEEMDIETGCSEPRSIVIAPGGIFFQSPNGIYMLARSRTISYVGKDVESTIAAYPVIVSASLDDITHCCMWEAVTAEGSGDGVTIVFDYLHNRWFVDRKIDTDLTAPTGAQGATIIGGTYYWATPGGSVFIETDGAYFDADNWITGQLSTAWIKLAGLQGYQRVRTATLLAKSTTGSNAINMSVYYSYDDTVVGDTFSWNAAELAALVTGRQQLQMNLTTQKSESLRIVFSDSESGSDNTGQGPVWVGLALEVGIKQGTFKMPTANSK